MSNPDVYDLRYPMSGLRALGEYQDDGKGGLQIKVDIFEEGPGDEERVVFTKTLYAQFLLEGTSRRWFLEMLSGVLLDAYQRGREVNQDNISGSLHTLMFHMGVRR